ncbi:MAG: hypothetical protein O8C61_05260 [Candidatus Methanoperedens sp.]|nr:hypothetical protein [Candidatus Methanoperedens sp.]
MNSNKQYKCPNCKHSIKIKSMDFIMGIAMMSCVDCGSGAFAVDENMLGLRK